MRGDRPTYACVDLEAIAHNYDEARRRAGARTVYAVVKADAYGHGAVPVARRLADAGCRDFAVVTVAEAVELREAGIPGTVLVLGGVHDPDEAEAAARHALTPVLHFDEQVVWMADAARRLSTVLETQLEVDTGMHRMGAPGDEALALVEAVGRTPSLALRGVFTHLARADESDLEASRAQLAAFRDWLRKLGERGVRPDRVHALNSAGLLSEPALADLPESDAVRPGLMLYGVLPAPHLSAPLRPAMSLRTRVVRVRRIGAGDAVGYAALFRALKPTRIATLALGYADGVPITASNRAAAVVRGRRFPAVGRVSMDYVTLDVGDAPVEVGDDALVFGELDGAQLPVEEAAGAAGTISYELLVRVGRRVPRVYASD